MSATGRGTPRRADDAYYTPEWCVHRLLEEQPFGDARDGAWLEPCAGDGAIIRAVQSFGLHPDHTWDAVELREECDPLLRSLPHTRVWTGHRDFLKLAADGLHDAAHPLYPTRGAKPFDVVITNPPYSLAMQFIERCLLLADHVAMLLRLNFLGSAKRAEWMRLNPPDVYVLPNRPSFTGGGRTDATEYGWLVWPPDPEPRGRIEVLRTTPANIRSARR